MAKEFYDWYNDLVDLLEQASDSLGVNGAKQALLEAVSNTDDWDDVDFDALSDALGIEELEESEDKLYNVVLDEDYSPLGHDEYLAGPVTLEEAKAFIDKKSKERADYEFPKSSKTMREAAAEEYAKRYSIMEADDD